jgi:hypothetical protein
MNKVQLEKIKRELENNKEACQRLEVENEEVKFNRQLLRFLAIAMEV